MYLLRIKISIRTHKNRHQLFFQFRVHCEWLFWNPIYCTNPQLCHQDCSNWLQKLPVSERQTKFTVTRNCSLSTHFIFLSCRHRAIIIQLKITSALWIVGMWDINVSLNALTRGKWRHSWIFSGQKHAACGADSGLFAWCEWRDGE